MKKKKIVKGSLCIISFLLFCLIYFNVLKENKTVVADTIFTNVKEKELINLITNSTSVVTLINDKTDINSVVPLLNSINTKEKIYVYNIKNDEEILDVNESGEVYTKQKGSAFYETLLNTLGSFTENYHIKKEDGSVVETDKRKIYAPMVLFIKNGTIMLSHYLNEETTTEELIEIYKTGYNIISGKYNS